MAVVAGDVDFGAWGSRMHCSPVAVGIHRPDSSWLLLLGWILTQKNPIKSQYVNPDKSNTAPHTAASVFLDYVIAP